MLGLASSSNSNSRGQKGQGMAVLIVVVPTMLIDVPRDRVSLDTLLFSLGQLLQCLLPLWVEEGGVGAGLVGEGDGRY